MPHRLLLLLRTLRADLGLWWRALRSRDRPRWLWPATLLLLAYAISPVDLIPDFVPLVGWIDDAALLALVIHQISKRLRARMTTRPVMLPQAR